MWWWVPAADGLVSYVGRLQVVARGDMSRKPLLTYGVVAAAWW
jgi:hypothetical protein